MRVFAPLAAACAVLLASPGAFAQLAEPYIQIDAGPTWFTGNISGVTNDFDTGWNVDGKIGTRLGSILRAEAELGYQQADIDNPTASGDLSSLNLMVNGLVDLPKFAMFTPYIGAGLGAARVTADYTDTAPAVTVDDSDWAFAWQALAGLDWNLTDRAALNVGYKYFDAGDASPGGIKVDDRSHSVNVGLRFMF